MVHGIVRDSSGAYVAQSPLVLLNSAQSVAASAITDSKGEFQFKGVPVGDYVLVAQRRGLVERRLPLKVASTSNTLEVTLDAERTGDAVTVTASPGFIDRLETASQEVNLIDRNTIDQRAKSVVAQVATEEAGVAWQRTSPTISGIFVRGLTGNKVNVFVDGVRYSTSAMRGGINTFLNLVDSSGIDSVEILRGPSSAQYGSDSLGGSIQFLSPLLLADQNAPWHGQFSSFFNSADTGYGSNVRTSYARGTLGASVNLTGQRANKLRTGQGIDSRSAVTRFLGLPSSFAFEGSSPDTAFTQYGGNMRLQWAPTRNSQIITNYQRSQQDGGKRFDQLIGGDGNLIADLRNLMLDLFYVRLQQQNLGWLDQLSATYSFNVQREERVNQGGNGNPRAAINHEPERTRVHGLQAHGTKRIVSHWNLFAGGEYYREAIAAPSYAYNPATNLFSARRGRVPDNAKYSSGGGYLQNAVDLLNQKVKITGNVRFGTTNYNSRASDSPLVGGVRLWPDDSFSVNYATFRVAAVATVAPGFNLVANVSRGFRAPHVTDLGTLGLTGAGFVVAAPDIAGLGATIGSTAGADAVSIGVPAAQVKPESSMSYEGGVRYRNNKLSMQANVFVNNISDNIVNQSLILPAGAVGKFLGSERITSQNAAGVVFVAATSTPVLIRTNFDTARIKGFESRVEYKPSRNWMIGGTFTYLNALDIRTGLAPNIEGGTPAPDGYLRLRYAPMAKRFWIEPFVHAANSQTRLSSLDLSDRRTGATRTRGAISNYFNNGAVVRGLVTNGILRATGETLAQVQNRLLGSAASAPLYTKINGYATFNVRAGYRLGEQQDLMVEFENIGDRNYRGISSGIDAPGRGAFVRYAIHF